MQELKRFGSILGEEQELRVVVCTTNVGCNVAGACGYLIGAGDLLGRKRARQG